MNESKEYYSPDEVAALVDLHVRTIRRFIREGRLKAVQVGKQYRIARSELEKLVGSNRGRESAESHNRLRRILISTTVDIDAISQVEQERLVNLLISAFQSLNCEQSSRRFDSIYYEDEGRLRLLINADLDSTSVVLGLMREVLKDTGQKTE